MVLLKSLPCKVLTILSHYSSPEPGSNRGRKTIGKLTTFFVDLPGYRRESAQQEKAQKRLSGRRASPLFKELLGEGPPLQPACLGGSCIPARGNGEYIYTTAITTRMIELLDKAQSAI